MRKPNGYGAVIKLSGNRRKPYAVRVTTGWTPEGKQKTKYIGYYSARKDAEIALANYNRNPYVLTDDITLGELYDRFIATRSDASTSTLNAYRTASNTLADIFTVPISKLNLGALQTFIDTSPKNKPTLLQAKKLLGVMFDYAIVNELLPPERKQIISHLDLSKKGNPNAISRSIFTHEEINKLWKDGSDIAHYILMLIYTGVRINELLKLPRKNVHLDKQYFDITSAKTKAGIRQVPIADKVLPFFETFPYEQMTYSSFVPWKFHPLLESLGMEHTPHDARHTFISLMTEKEVDERIIKAIVGHKGSGVTEAVYTHIPMRKLIAAVNLL